MMNLQRRYGVATTIRRALMKPDGSNATSSDWTPATGDVKVSKDGGAQANIGTLPVYDDGNWLFTFTAAEMQAQDVVVAIVDTAPKAVLDEVFTIETKDSPSARHPNGIDGKKLYVSTSGDDANDGYSWDRAKLTPKATIEGAPDGATVYIGPGDFRTGTEFISAPYGTRVIGAGMDVTFIDAFVCIGGPAYLRDLTCTTPAAIDAVPALSIDGGTALRVRGEGLADCFHVYGSGHLILIDCVGSSEFDVLTCASGGKLTVLGGHFYGSGERNATMNLFSGGSVVLLKNATLERSSLLGPDGAAYVLVVATSAARVIVDGCTLINRATSGTRRSIYNAGTAEVIVSNTTYDHTITEGPITQMDTPGNVTGKVLGGGSGTITGTGARVVDHAGNSIAPASTALSSAVWTNAKAELVDASIAAARIAAEANRATLEHATHGLVNLHAVASVASAQSTTAAAQSTAANDKLPSNTATLLGRLDATVSSVAGSVWSYLTSAADALTTTTMGKWLRTMIDVAVGSRATPADVEVDANGDGDHAIDHNGGSGTGGAAVTVNGVASAADSLRYTDGSSGIDNVTIKAFAKSSYDASTGAGLLATTYTGSDGRWVAPLYLDSGIYYLIAHKPGVFAARVVTLVVP